MFPIYLTFTPSLISILILALQAIESNPILHLFYPDEGFVSSERLMTAV